MPQIIEAKPEADFWALMCKTRPERAIAELVWNAKDAEADRINVSIKLNGLDGIDQITIADNGPGIVPNVDDHDFSHLGGSWKAQVQKTKNLGRILHGKNGQGRFRAFSLGSNVTWDTAYSLNGSNHKYSISGSTQSPGKFMIGDSQQWSGTETGTTVTIVNVDESAHRLRLPSSYDDLSRVFAPYLNQSRNISLSIDNRPIDSANLVMRSAEFPIGPIKMSDGSELSGNLEIIEWKSISGRALYLCDEEGFALAERTPDIRAPGFNFGAYLKSSIFRELDEGQLLDLELTETVTVLVAAAKQKLTEYFRKREQEQASSLIDRWKTEKVYPYEEPPKTESGKKAQSIFNVCAVTIHDHASGFDQQDVQMKALSFRLLREAIEVNPSSVATILNKFLSLPKKKQELLNELLERTTLSSIIDAVHHVEMRIAVAKGLRALVCDSETRNSVKEREHIHKIVEDNSWLFGEQFALGVSESSLTNLLRNHLKLLKRDEKVLDPILKANGKAGRIDLLLARKIKRSGRDDDEHLIIELKRASTVLGQKELTQLKEYANVVMKDPRFEKTAVSWSFWLVGVRLDSDLEEEANSGDREPGCAHVFKNGRGKIWVKTWGQIVHDSLCRLEYFQDKLNIAITEQEAVEVLERVYSEFVPTAKN